MDLQTWGVDHLPDVLRLWNRSCPSEPLTAAELDTGLADDGDLLAASDGTAVIAFVQGTGEARHRGNVRLLVVAPEARRRGLGRALLQAAEDRLRSRGVTSIRLAGGVPRYLWPGIDATNTAARALARACGYTVVGTAVNMAIPTEFRAAAPEGLDVRWVDDENTPDLLAFVDEHWPLWGTEVRIAAERGTLCGAWAGVEPVGFVAHSTMRTGWIGPMGTGLDHRGHGVGAALLSAACADLERRGHASAEIAWVGPVEYFLAKGARVTRTFERYVRELT